MTANGWYPNGYFVKGHWIDGWWPAWAGIIISYKGEIVNLISRICMSVSFVAAIVVADTLESRVAREMYIESPTNEE